MSEASNYGPTTGPSIAELITSFRSGISTPRTVVEQTMSTIRSRGDDGVWISLATEAQLNYRLQELAELYTDLPLYGVPFGVKDSIDIQGWKTTLACPDYAYVASATAPVVQRLLDAGAILIGKTNLDQFATGLNGTRTPYTVPRSVFGHELISGGSSSGSAVAVALGEVPFTVATDTAGSGRVPPALNGVLGFKPSRGLISTVGLVPACRSLDCVSLIASSVEDLSMVFQIVEGLDPRDAWSRLRPEHEPRPIRIGLPDFSELDFFNDEPMSEAHHSTRQLVAASFDNVSTPALQPFLAAGELLYQGPWVAERFVEFGGFLAEHPNSAMPVVADIIRGGASFSALDVFRAQYRLAELKAEVARIFQDIDVLVLPTIGTTFTVQQVLDAPIATNTILGHYTHFGNLLDLCAIAFPAGLTSDGRPASVMILGPALTDAVVLNAAAVIASALSSVVIKQLSTVTS